MDMFFKRGLFWMTFVVGVFFLGMSFVFTTFNSAMLSFTVGVVFIVVAVAVVIFGGAFIKNQPPPNLAADPLRIGYTVNEVSREIEKVVVVNRKEDIPFLRKVVPEKKPPVRKFDRFKAPDKPKKVESAGISDTGQDAGEKALESVLSAWGSLGALDTKNT